MHHLVVNIINSIPLGRMLSIRNLLRIGVIRVRRPLVEDIPGLNRRQHGPERPRRERQDVGDGVRGVFEAGVEGPGEGAVQEDGWVVARHGVPGAVDVAGVLGDELEDVGADVPAAEGVEVPVGLDRSNIRVVVVELVVGCALEFFWDGAAEKNAEDAVADVVGVCSLLAVALGRASTRLTVLVESQKDQGAVHEVFVGEERLKEVARPGAGDGDGRIVAVRGHVGGDEAPLGKSFRLEVVEELGGVLLV